MELIDGAIYILKKGLFLHKYGEKSSLSLWGDGSVLNPGSQVYYDQYSNGWHIFGGLGDAHGYYVAITEEFLEEEIEIDLSPEYKDIRIPKLNESNKAAKDDQ